MNVEIEKHLYIIAITFASGVLSSLLTIKLGLNKDLISIKRERIETYATSLMSMGDMLEKYRQRYLFGKDEVEISEEDLGRVEALTKLYFMNVYVNFCEFKKTLNLYKKNLFEIQQKLLHIQRTSEHPEFKAIPTQLMVDYNVRLFMDVYEARTSLLDALIRAYPLLENKLWFSGFIHKLRSSFH